MWTQLQVSLLSPTCKLLKLSKWSYMLTHQDFLCFTDIVAHSFILLKEHLTKNLDTTVGGTILPRRLFWWCLINAHKCTDKVQGGDTKESNRVVVNGLYTVKCAKFRYKKWTVENSSSCPKTIFKVSRFKQKVRFETPKLREKFAWGEFWKAP